MGERPLSGFATSPPILGESGGGNIASTTGRPPPTPGKGSESYTMSPSRLSPRIGGEVAKPERGPLPHQPTLPK